MTSPVAAVRCPQCGADVAVLEDSFVTCESCRATLWIDLRRVVPHLALRQRIGPGEARGAVEGFLAQCEVAGAPTDLAARPELHPWWVVRGPGRDEVIPAAAACAFDAAPRAAVAGGSAMPFDAEAARSAEVIGPSVSSDEALAALGDPRGATIHLLHVPVYRVDFRHGGQRWTAFVDAVTGRVDALALPGAASRRFDRAAGVRFAASIGLFTLIAALVPGFWLSLLVTAAACGAVLYFAWRPGSRSGSRSGARTGGGRA